MNHLIFEEWIFSEETLDDGQIKQLKNHLDSCEHCRELVSAWKRVGTTLQTRVIVPPTAGFSERWQARLHENIKTNQRLRFRRQTRIILGVSLAASVLLFTLVAILSWPILQAPKMLLWTYLAQILQWIFVADWLQGLASGFLQSITTRVPWFVGIILVVVASGSALLWVISFRWLTRPREIRL